MTDATASATRTTTIAALIPTRNRRELVCRAVRSTLAQTRPPNEIVVVDDGSTDGAGDAVRRLDPRVRVVRTEGLGPAGARNAGARAARAEWLALLDSDDVWLPHHLDAVANALATTAAPPPAVVFADAVLPGSDETVYGRAGFAPGAPATRVEDAAGWALMRLQPMMPSATAIRRADWLAVGGMDEQIECREDTYLYLRLALAGLPFVALATLGARMHRTNVSQMASLKAPGTEAWWRATVDMYAGCLEVGGGGDTARRELRRRVATAEWRLSRLRWQNGRRSAALRNLLASVGRDPAVVAGRVARRPG
jgi:glycosyltransferase involved in cell wall biosynthesis